eukprot:2003984-Karenia_brevis.AAC.1
MTEDQDKENGTFKSQQCKLSAGAEPLIKPKWHKAAHSGAVQSGLLCGGGREGATLSRSPCGSPQLVLALAQPALVQAMRPGHQLTTTVAATAITVFSAICSAA